MIFQNWGLNGMTFLTEGYRTILYVGFERSSGRFSKVQGWFKFDARTYHDYSYYAEGSYCGYNGGGSAGWVGIPRNFVIDVTEARDVEH